MSKRIIFISKCPSCENNQFIRWSHSGCQYSYYYLDTFGDLTCNECHKVANLLQMRFKCSSHSCYKACLDDNNQLKTINNLIIKKMDIDDGDFKAELLYNIAIRYNKYN